MQLGKLGIWANLEGLSSLETADFAKRTEAAGYCSLWFPEARGRNAMASAAWLLASTERLIVGTGIANIYARDAQATFAAQQGLNEQSGGRFLLGLGVSHKPLVTDLRGHDYGKPIAAMQAYRDAMAACEYGSVPPAEPPLTVLAALGPKMLGLARDTADGALPYNVTPEHTREARTILGSGKLLCVEQMVVDETDPEKARDIARRNFGFYTLLPNYCNNWRRLGFEDADFANGGSDRLIDANVAWGGNEKITERIDEHFAAGADHVCIQVLTDSEKPEIALVEKLAKVLL
jgi:probable F420-dependent oxidoreductase